MGLALEIPTEQQSETFEKHKKRPGVNRDLCLVIVRVVLVQDQRT